MDEYDIQKIMVSGGEGLPEKYREIIVKEIRGYCQQIYHNIRELGYNMDLTQIIFVGGGAGVMKRFGGLEQKNIQYLEDVKANAKGYEMLGNAYLAQAQIGDKKYKFLLYATGLENVCLILRDYIELNYQSGFTLTMAKEFDSCVILTDNLKERKVDDASIAYLKNEITMAEYVDKMDDETEDSDEESKPDEKKFYQIETKITFDEEQRTQTFVVNTFNVDRAMMLITHYLKNKEEECEKQAKEKGHEFNKREIHAAIESAKPIPVGRFIPKEFSMAYME